MARIDVRVVVCDHGQQMNGIAAGRFFEGQLVRGPGGCKRWQDGGLTLCHRYHDRDQGEEDGGEGHQPRSHRCCVYGISPRLMSLITISALPGLIYSLRGERGVSAGHTSTLVELAARFPRGKQQRTWKGQARRARAASRARATASRPSSVRPRGG